MISTQFRHPLITPHSTGLDHADREAAVDAMLRPKTVANRGVAVAKQKGMEQSKLHFYYCSAAHTPRMLVLQHAPPCGCPACLHFFADPLDTHLTGSPFSVVVLPESDSWLRRGP